jgi:hypothetical protein
MQKDVMKKFLPIGVQDFAQMITGNFVYVDKTRYVYEMAHVPQAFYFLSRPRRFGKSLLVSTLKSLFEDRKDLFKGLWIENCNWEWKPHPVVIVDFNGIDATNAAILEESLSLALDKIAGAHGIALSARILTNKFVELFAELHKKSREKIVVLIDEYDKPIITHLGKGEEDLQIARTNRDVLKKFFGVLKEAHVSSILRFVFITGISKFSKVGIFSDLNNLQDLSMHSAYAGLLGYTQQELETYFNDWIEEFARHWQTTRGEILHMLQEWYNGYRFTKMDLQIYNPFSILNVLSEYDFKNFWFETGTPSLLVNLIKEKYYPIPNLEKLEIQEAAFSTYELENLQLEALFFQTGYLTIHAYDGILYRLGYPNQEVKSSFLGYLYQSLVELPDTTLKAQYTRLHQYLAQENFEQFIETVNAIMSSIPYPHIQGQDERYYHTVFYLMLAPSGALVHTEPLTSHGRIDMAVEFKDKVYVVDLKCNQAAEEAIQQIHQKRYFEKYLQSGRKIYLVGINFDTQARAIKDWRFEKLPDRS